MFREIMAKFQRHNQLENRAKRVYDLAMDGIITKDNAINSLLDIHNKADHNLQLKIVNRIKTIWNR